MSFEFVRSHSESDAIQKNHFRECFGNLEQVMKVPLAGVVIAYFPDVEKLSSNLKTYLDSLDHLFIIFNSPVSASDANRLTSLSPKIQPFYNDENAGIAGPLNQAAQQALDLGYEWLLTMDQDSWFLSDEFFKAFTNYPDKSTVAIFGPTVLTAAELEVIQSLPSADKTPDETEDVLAIITSGNLLNLGIWKKTGGFEEKLFIDEVDNDYCLKAVSQGYRIVRMKNIHLVHALGHEREVTFLFQKKKIITHPPLRTYYIFRNNLYVFNKYKKIFPEFVRARKRILLKTFLKILFFSRERLSNLRCIQIGIRDYLQNTYGRYPGKIKAT